MLSCPKHRGYTGKIKPRVSCVHCWGVYLGAQLDGPCHNSNAFVRILKRKRIAMGLSANALDRRISRSLGYISSVEASRGTKGTSRNMANRLADVFSLYGDERLIFVYDATRINQRRSIVAFDVTSDVGQAVIRKVLNEYAQVSK